jgi:predicted lysophospholipase L1 biosynthesis ABC-type transport system permease subunit
VFDDRDGQGALATAVISASFAERFWPGEDPIGKRVLRGANANPATVIGIVGDVRDVTLSRAPEPLIYIAHAQSAVNPAPVSLVVRTAGDPLALTNAIRAAVFSVDPAQPIDHVTTVERFLADSLGPQRFRSALLLVLAGIGVTLAAIGVYGVTSRAVQERTQELGVRLALGASHAAVVRTVARQTLQPVVVGLVAGVALSAAAAIALLRALPDLAAGDTWTSVPALVILALTAIVAVLVPARHAASLDPVIALRAQ